MTKNYISLIGTSRITEHHIKAAKKCGFLIYSISSSRKNSKHLKSIAKKNNIKKIFYSYKECISSSNLKENISYIVTCKLSDNKKILNELLKYKKKILIEKPVFLNHKNFKGMDKYSNFIFVGYNRIFYNLVKTLKNKLNLKKRTNVICTVPEINKRNISINSCHIVSIIMYLFGSLKIINISRSSKYINTKLVSKNSDINIFFNFNASENFEIKFFNDEKIFKLCPIEKLSIYKDFKITNSNGMRKYFPKIIYEKEELNKGFKQGFIGQYEAFKKFVDTNINVSDINFAEQIIKICNEIEGRS